MAKCGICGSRRCYGHTTRERNLDTYAGIEAEMRRRGFRVNEPQPDRVGKAVKVAGKVLRRALR